MTRRLAGIVLAIAAVLLIGGLDRAFAHDCENPDNTNCRPTPVQPDWRAGNWIPLFDIDRDCSNAAGSTDPCGDDVDHDSNGDGVIDGRDARYDAQRWRDECAQPGQVEDNQFCVWLDFGTSLFSGGDPDPFNAEPNEVHAGTAGSHCFLSEFAHDCEDHYIPGPYSEGVHDAHGGSSWVDLCLAANPDSKYCDDGLKDTQAGVIVMDHNPCGLPIPIVACIDEYHVVRPFDTDRTVEQMQESAAYAQQIADDPATYLCGKRDQDSYIDGDGNETCHRLVNREFFGGGVVG